MFSHKFPVALEVVVNETNRVLEARSGLGLIRSSLFDVMWKGRGSDWGSCSCSIRGNKVCVMLWAELSRNAKHFHVSVEWSRTEIWMNTCWPASCKWMIHLHHNLQKPGVHTSVIFNCNSPLRIKSQLKLCDIPGPPGYSWISVGKSFCCSSWLYHLCSIVSANWRCNSGVFLFLSIYGFQTHLCPPPPVHPDPLSFSCSILILYFFVVQ